MTTFPAGIEGDDGERHGLLLAAKDSVGVAPAHAEGRRTPGDVATTPARHSAAGSEVADGRAAWKPGTDDAPGR